MVTSVMFMSPITCFMVSIGQGAPAMMPVRRAERSAFANSGWDRMAMNMVGTP